MQRVWRFLLTRSPMNLFSGASLLEIAGNMIIFKHNYLYSPFTYERATHISIKERPRVELEVILD